MSTLYDDLVAADVPIDSHGSDLQFKWNMKAQEIYAAHQERRKEAGECPLRVSTFHSQLPGERGQWWAEVPFAFNPFWKSPQ